MAENSLPQNEWERNRYAEIIEDLSEYVSPEAMYHYLWELESLVHSVEIVLEDLR